MAAVAQLQALGILCSPEVGAQLSPPVTLGHPVWRLQLAVLWRSPSPFQLAPPLLLCELGAEAQPLWAGGRVGVQGQGVWKNPESPILVSHPLALTG